MDLFMAGSETTANTLGFTILLLLKNPEACRKAAEELDRVVGRDRTPSLSDRSRVLAGALGFELDGNSNHPIPDK
ncbi:hypothetical protein J437_LFUL008631 [Ladona fulva]|uniref:Cytochrome P450 n=1 Tax=Ladona fulva TaxID=123851 RepID=A0A8K0K9V0_LADFU|nr:hypothetical protein J437_LFUL008631 [Ladona fulva]